MQLFPILSTVMAAILAAGGTAQVPPSPPVRVLDSTSGQDSLVAEPTVELIRDNTEWQQLWRVHKADPSKMPHLVVEPAPNIDFTKNMVLAVFSGETSQGVTYKVAGVDNAADMVTLRIGADPVVNVPGLRLGGRSYTFFLLTKSDKAINVEMPVNREWQVITQFPAVKKAGKSGRAGG